MDGKEFDQHISAPVHGGKRRRAHDPDLFQQMDELQKHGPTGNMEWAVDTPKAYLFYNPDDLVEVIKGR